MSGHDWTPEDRARHAETLVAEAIDANARAREALAELFRSWGYEARLSSGYVRVGGELLTLELGYHMIAPCVTARQRKLLGGATTVPVGEGLAQRLRALVEADVVKDLAGARAKLAEAQADVERLEAAAGGASEGGTELLGSCAVHPDGCPAEAPELQPGPSGEEPF